MPLSILEHDSALLAGNPCGDPARRELWVYTPPGYEDDPARRYPVLWCLVGYSGTGANAVQGNRWSPGLAARLDRMIAERRCAPVIVAFPDCFTRFGGSQYVNSAAQGPYEDYVCDELIPFVDANFRTLPDAAHRGVFGKSSGGYGALRLTMRRPGLFGAVVSHSGDAGFWFCYQPTFAATVAALAAAGGVERFVEKLESHEKKHDFIAMGTLGMAACYSPDASQPFGFALPMDLETGALIPDVWERWKAFDPVEMVRETKHADALRSLKLLFLDCGSKDEWQHHLGLRLLAKRLDEAGVAYELEEFPDSHRSISYRYEVSLPKLARALSPDAS